MRETIELLCMLIFFFLMIPASVFDIGSKTVPRWLIAVSFLPGVVSLLAGGPAMARLLGLILPAVMGMLWLIFPKGRQNIGGADVALALAGGLVLSTASYLWGLFFSGLAALPFAVILRRKNREAVLPFVPFLTVGFIFGKMCEVIFCA